MSYLGSQYVEIILTQEEAFRIEQGLFTIPYDPLGSDDYISNLKIAAYKVFPAHLIKKLEQEKIAYKPSACIVINNLPIDKNIFGSPGFHETGSVYKAGTLSENVITAVALFLGEPYSIQFEGVELVNNIVPHQHHIDAYTGLGSKAELDLHIENSALNFIFEDDCSPSGVLLMGLRQDPYAEVRTYCSDARLALDLLDEETQAILRSNCFHIKLPYRWRATLNQVMTDKVAIVSGSKESPRIHAVFYPDMIYIDDRKAQTAFYEFYAALKKIAIGINIKPRQLIYINNRFALHAREAFTPAYDKNGLGYRWLQRVFISQDLWGMRDFRLSGRIYDPSLIKRNHMDKN